MFAGCNIILSVWEGVSLEKNIWTFPYSNARKLGYRGAWTSFRTNFVKKYFNFPSLIPTEKKVFFHFLGEGTDFIFFRLKTSLCCYIAQHFHCNLVFRATNASYVFYMYYVIHLELQSSWQPKNGLIPLKKKPDVWHRNQIFCD